MPVNVEIKAKCSDFNALRTILQSKNADFRGTDHQVDTYFNVPFGRLKLREGNIENCLIYYTRENKAGPKESRVMLLETMPHSKLKEILVSALGVKVVVEKRREIYFHENVKFHLDTVEGLGTFVEIEAIDTDGTIGPEKLLQQCQYFTELFRIPHSDLISGSYSDLVLSA